METFRTLLNVKFKSYNLAIQFLISISVPGILILFYFYRELFVSYDLNRLIMLIIAISASILISAYFICSTILFLVEFINKESDAVFDENEYLETVFVMSSLFSLVILLITLVIFFWIGSKNIHIFIICFLAGELLYGIILFFSLNSLIKEIVREYKKEESLFLNAEEDNTEKIKFIKKELFKLSRQLALSEAELNEKKKFQFLRTQQERRNGILRITDRIHKIKVRIKDLEAELKNLS